MPVDLVDVPVDRIVANLQGLIAREPKNAKLRYALARAHAIAYAALDPRHTNIVAGNET